jgi:hypothetical protein
MPATTVLTQAQQQRLDALRQHAARRREALAAEQATRRVFQAAVLAALGAGAGAPDVVAASGGAVTRQAPHQLVSRRGPDAPARAWEDAGRPDRRAALAKVGQAGPAWAEARRRLTGATETVVMHMRQCRDAGIPPTAIAAGSGFASAAAYDYLAALDVETRAVAALRAAGLVGRYDPQEDAEVDDVLVRRNGTKVTARLGIFRQDTRRLAEEAARALAAVGLHVDEAALAAEWDRPLGEVLRHTPPEITRMRSAPL